MDKLSKIFNNEYRFWIVRCEEGYRITSWKEGDDIKDYSSFNIAYCPEDANLDIYYCITAEDDTRYESLKRQALEEEYKLKQDKYDEAVDYFNTQQKIVIQ